jgi:hypothetical protein
MRSLLLFLNSFLFLAATAVQAADCDLGVHYGTRDTGVLLHSSCGTKFRVIFAKTISHDDDVFYGFQNNRYSYMLGAAYRWKIKRERFKRHSFDFGAVYIDRKTQLFLGKQYAVWLKWRYAITPRFHCGYTHQSVPFVDDAGRNQFGCDLSFDL